MRSIGDANWLVEGMEEFEAICLSLSGDVVNVSHILHAFVCDREKGRQIAKSNGGKLVSPPKPRIA
ncbi:MAG: hypothetical protein ACXWLQ_00130 [Rhizomicrobium sp.]